MNRLSVRRLLVAWATLLFLTTAHVTLAADTVVRAVLFYSPSCGHCHYVMTEVLPPLIDQYGDQLQIVGINISDPAGQAIYRDTIDQMAIPQSRQGVPALLVGDTILVGSGEIPERFPEMIAAALAAEGIDWPDIPGLDGILAANGLAEATDPAAPPAVAAATGTETMWDRVARDPLGNGLAILLLLGMVTALVLAVVRLWQVGLTFAGWPDWKAWAVAALAVIGLGVSAYMAYVETTDTAAVCGPVGDCNSVQQSEYAALFGVLPIGVLGMVGYGLILLSWAGVRWGKGSLRRTAEVALLALAVLGTLFSIYLTFLEPFVIGATCAWCLTSAVVMTLILLLSLPAAQPPPRAVRQARAKA